MRTKCGRVAEGFATLPPNLWALYSTWLGGGPLKKRDFIIGLWIAVAIELAYLLSLSGYWPDAPLLFAVGLIVSTLVLGVLTVLAYPWDRS